MTKKENILVLGSTGKTGSRVAARLTALGYNVRMGSRKAAIPFDWDDASTWKPALQGMDAVYISFQPDVAIPGADKTITAFSKLAVENGAKRLVMLSGRGEPEARACEEVVMRSGADWTIVRASWFMQNYTESFLLDAILAGHVHLPVSEIGEPFIDVNDIADVAVAALTQPGHTGKVHEVTGPELITFKEAVHEISEATGRKINYKEISADEYVSTLEMYGVPQEVISLLQYLFTEVMDGRNASVTNTVENVLGRKPGNFSTFVKKAIEQGVWQQQLQHHQNQL